MIAPTPTTLQLSSEDIREYEQQKKKWEKKKKEPYSSGKGFRRAGDVDAVNKYLHKKEVQDRIGLSKP